MVDYVTIPKVLDKATCRALCSEIRAATGEAAGLLGRSDQKPQWSQVRQTRRAEVSLAAQALIKRLLEQQKTVLERHFAIALGAFEKPQFLHYQEGDFFVPHQDGNTPIIRDESRFRKISMVIFLNGQSDEPSPEDYSGGSLVLHGPYSGPELRVAMLALPGSVVAFRSETTHEVTPVTRNERFTIVSWYRGA
ncbi:2OG-Fe(II) oxygenase [Mesorhizobium sp. B3-1-7]|uniref:2OG-Fe(II) oxygenase n=1 Tax=Mesorhizobium sp. B3-1-7 TaxID=2589894 RepID=UPI00112B1EBA|nr:2OG-Fe(II) oxygenase [Mesorhizobium sp. B3-1-7]TPI51524.1 2OG-Fe(II) oxygenase [Mesorhizobium sp. B3-1-7]